MTSLGKTFVANCSGLTMQSCIRIAIARFGAGKESFCPENLYMRRSFYTL